MIGYERRACAVLYNLIRSAGAQRKFLLPANVCPVVPMTFQRARVPYELIDIERDGLCLDLDRCAERIAAAPDAYGGVLFARTYGVDLDPSQAFERFRALQPDLLLIDDKCLCPPTLSNSGATPAADATLYSTGYAKYIDMGEGGFAHLRRGVAYRRYRAPFNEAGLERASADSKKALAAGVPYDASDEPWLDLRLPERSWDDYGSRLEAQARPAVEHKAAMNAIYRGGLPDSIQLDERFQGWRFQLLVPEPDALIARIFEAGLFASRHYSSLGGVFGGGRFPHCDAVHSRVVNLFNDRHIDAPRARGLVEVVLRHLDRSA